jgi:hypothetical protein
MNSRPSSFANFGFLDNLYVQILHGLYCCGREPYSATTLTTLMKETAEFSKSLAHYY